MFVEVVLDVEFEARDVVVWFAAAATSAAFAPHALAMASVVFLSTLVVWLSAAAIAAATHCVWTVVESVTLAAAMVALEAAAAASAASIAAVSVELAAASVEVELLEEALLFFLRASRVLAWASRLYP